MGTFYVVVTSILFDQQYYIYVSVNLWRERTPQNVKKNLRESIKTTKSV